ncbi:MAG: DUF6448 family protein [Candidatus Bathyarchaeia archaeon]
MPPHCDTLDGPVVMAAKKALETGNINFILPWVPKKAEDELRRAFKKTLQARKLGKEAVEVADYWFFETAVRLHREGEGAPYTGLKPAGLDWGPIVPRADRAIEKGDAKEVIHFIMHAVEEELEKRFRHTMEKKNYDVNDVDAAREYVQAMLGFVLYAHHLYEFVKGGKMHGEEGMAGHKH